MMRSLLVQALLAAVALGGPAALRPREALGEVARGEKAALLPRDDSLKEARTNEAVEAEVSDMSIAAAVYGEYSSGREYQSEPVKWTVTVSPDPGLFTKKNAKPNPLADDGHGSWERFASAVLGARQKDKGFAITDLRLLLVDPSKVAKDKRILAEARNEAYTLKMKQLRAFDRDTLSPVREATELDAASDSPGMTDLLKLGMKVEKSKVYNHEKFSLGDNVGYRSPSDTWKVGIDKEGQISVSK